MLALLFTVLLIVAAAVQSTVIAHLDLGGGRPDLVLLLVLAWGILRGPSEGVVAGVLGGFALDTLSGTPFGVQMGLLGLIGFSTSLGESTLYRGNLPLFFGVGVLSTVVFHVGLALLFQLLGLQPPSLARFVHVLGPTALLNGALMPGVIWLVRRSMRWMQGWRQIEV